MKDPLDKDELPNVFPLTRLSRNSGWKSLGYFFIMLVPGYFLQQFTTWKNSPFISTLLEAVKFMFFCLLAGFLIEAIRWLVRGIKQKRSGVRKIVDPYWFQGIESGFSVWILFSVFYMLIYFFYY